MTIVRIASQDQHSQSRHIQLVAFEELGPARLLQEAKSYRRINSNAVFQVRESDQPDDAIPHQSSLHFLELLLDRPPESLEDVYERNNNHCQQGDWNDEDDRSHIDQEVAAFDALVSHLLIILFYHVFCFELKVFFREEGLQQEVWVERFKVDQSTNLRDDDDHVCRHLNLVQRDRLHQLDVEIEPPHIVYRSLQCYLDDNLNNQKDRRSSSIVAHLALQLVSIDVVGQLSRNRHLKERISSISILIWIIIIVIHVSFVCFRCKLPAIFDDEAADIPWRAQRYVQRLLK